MAKKKYKPAEGSKKWKANLDSDLACGNMSQHTYDWLLRTGLENKAHKKELKAANKERYKDEPPCVVGSDEWYNRWSTGMHESYERYVAEREERMAARIE